MEKINLEDPAVSVREARLGSITGFNGTAGELVKCAHAGKLKDCSRSFSQCLGCSAGNAFCQLAMIKDAAVVNHAPIGCAGDFFGFNFVYRVGQMERGLPSTNGRYFNTNIEERDTVFGALEKLKSTVQEVYSRVHPNAIFITTSCASGIIGDDVEGAANELTQELGIPVVACFCEGFKSKIWTTGFDSAYHSIIRKIVKPPRKKTNKINIINFWGTHIFDEMLEKLGYQAEYIVPFTTISQLEYISEAVATIQICPTLGTYLGAALEQVYGVIEIKSPPGYGIAGTDAWMRELGTVLNRKEEVEEIIREEHKRIIPKIEGVSFHIKGENSISYSWSSSWARYHCTTS